MPFGLNISGGDFLPIVKYDARAGRFFRVDRHEVTGDREAVDITDGFECLPDFEHAEKGWAWFQSGQAPDFVMVPVESQGLPPQPSENHRQAVRLRLWLSAKAAGGTERLREIATTANTALNGFGALYDQWLANREHNPGKAPLVRLTGAKPVTSGGARQRSTNYEPQFTIAKWVNIPEAFQTAPEGAAPSGSTAAPDDYKAAKGGSAKPPAVPAQAPPPAENEEDDFG